MATVITAAGGTVVFRACSRDWDREGDGDGEGVFPPYTHDICTIMFINLLSLYTEAP